ncbi:MAG: hypothetical protein E6J75_11345, partial [Deltaproteobacteria bacterium]
YFFPLALVVIGVVHYHAFRTLQALFLPLVTALLSVLWAVGFMGLLGVPFDPYNTTRPILILAVAAGHAVQVLKRFYEEFERSGDVGEAIVASLGRVGPVMIAAGTIAALSFCSLVSFRTATIRTFGLFTGFGIASALVIELTIIPAVRALLPAPRGREREREAAAHPWLDGMLRLAHRASRPAVAPWVFGGAAVLVLLCIALATRITVDTSYKREFGAREPVRVEDAKINARFAGTNTLVLLVEGEGQGTLEEPTIMRAIYALERRLEGEPGVGKALSYVDFLRKMHLALTADRADQGELPGTRALTAQYLFLYSLSGGAEDFDTLIDPDHRVAKVRLLIHEDSTYFGQKLIGVAQELVAKTFPAGYRVRYTGSLASTAAATEVMVHGKVRNILQIALITFCIAALLLRSVTGGLLVAMPLALTVAVNFGVMGLLGIPLDTGCARSSPAARSSTPRSGARSARRARRCCSCRRRSRSATRRSASRASACTSSSGRSWRSRCSCPRRARFSSCPQSSAASGRRSCGAPRGPRRSSRRRRLRPVRGGRVPKPRCSDASGRMAPAVGGGVRGRPHAGGARDALLGGYGGGPLRRMGHDGARSGSDGALCVGEISLLRGRDRVRRRDRRGAAQPAARCVWRLAGRVIVVGVPAPRAPVSRSG